jgi:hypothetical protein
MNEATLTIQSSGNTLSVALRPGLTRIGSEGARGIHVGIAGAEGELHLWDDPHKVVRVSGSQSITVGGQVVEEFALDHGAVFEWCGAHFELDLGGTVLEELQAAPVPAPAPAPRAVGAAAGGPSESVSGVAGARGLGPIEAQAFDRIAAGVLVDVGLADKAVVKRWQAAVLAQEWDADAAARAILASSAGAMADPKFMARAARLERDLLMSSYQRGVKGASRRVRGAAKNSTAFFVANVVAISAYSAIILALLILARVSYDWDLNGIIDRMVDAVTP